MKSSGTHIVVLNWVLLVTVSVFGVYLSWDKGLLQVIIQTDNTRICLVILIAAAGGSLLAGWRSLYLSRQIEFFASIRQHVVTGGWPTLEGASLFPEGASISYDYLRHQDAKAHPSESQLLAEVMAEKARGNHQVGWFITGLMIKLGLLGTVVGFIMMLGTVEGLATVDLKDIKNLMQQMTQGMGIAMNTTLVGLIASMLLGIQYLLLDRTADKLVADTVMFAHRHNPASRASDNGNRGA